MGNVVAIPGTKIDHVSKEELEEYRAQRNGEDNLYEPGILDVPNAYDPSAGSKYAKTPRPDLTPGPIDATGETQPKNVSAKVISREKNSAVDRSEATRTGSAGTVDKSEHAVVSSGRKNAANK